MQVIFEKKLNHKLFFSLDDHVVDDLSITKPEEREGKYIVTIRETNQFKSAEINNDVHIELIEEWLEKYFEQIDTNLKTVVGMVKLLEMRKMKSP